MSGIVYLIVLTLDHSVLLKELSRICLYCVPAM